VCGEEMRKTRVSYCAPFVADSRYTEGPERADFGSPAHSGAIIESTSGVPRGRPARQRAGVGRLEHGLGREMAMATAWLLLARISGWEIFLTTLALAVALLLAAVVLKLIDRWRKRPVSDSLTPGDQLAQFRELYEQGHLSTEEFERI